MSNEQNVDNECTANYSTTCAFPEKTKKEKNTIMTKEEWFCKICKTQCNSQSQFEVHLMSMKHKNELKPEIPTADKPTAESANINSDDNNNVIASNSSIKVHTNEIAKQFKIDASKYFIPPDKKDGKYKKFGFYCDSCKVFMTGQIQLIMHLKGRNHLEKNSNEIPNYTPPPPKIKHVKKYHPSSFIKYESVNINQLQQELQVQQCAQVQYNIYQQQPLEYDQPPPARQYYQQSPPPPQTPQHHLRQPLQKHPVDNFLLPVNKGESMRLNQNGIITNDQKCPIREESNQSANTQTTIHHEHVIMTAQPLEPHQLSYNACHNGYCGQ